MKRINPDTNKEFLRGDKRPSTDKQDGKLFLCYQSKIIKSTGLNYETWYGEKRFNEFKEAEKNRAKKIVKSNEYKERVTRYNHETDISHLKKRLNENGKVFTFGEYKNGKYFIKYMASKEVYFTRRNKNLRDLVYFDEIWTNDIEEVWSYKFKQLVRLKKQKFEGTDIDENYLWSILPKDRCCPITKKPFNLKGLQDDSAELDRRDPSKGYIKGNVVFISRRMNRLKSDATADELLTLYHYIYKDFEVTKIN